MKLEDINMEIDYKDLAMVESTFMHDIKRLGEVECVYKYIKEIPNISFGSDVAYNLMVCLTKYFASKNGIECSLKIKEQSKWVLDPYDFGVIELSSINSVESNLLEDMVSDSLEPFKSSKIVFRNIEEAF